MVDYFLFLRYNECGVVWNRSRINNKESVQNVEPNGNDSEGTERVVRNVDRCWFNA